MDIRERIEIDIGKFDESIKKLGSAQLDKKQREIVELAKMYASDAKAWMKKGDLYTSFSSIAYAHGLMDSILKQNGIIE
ncbi:MAG: DUF357 domain-containing protein [Candidatus Micrarchaeota archaeon]|nr:DUF357 domain-containing protein [Candidatus Micrarchaeota archaeon]MDE1804800.1 DUF357 domain-containing protein [Candidatus Micrarchaeota archaeon]MDE1846879.1 DUF357 domain-containing protein [Candidatus Micrarchaeota archaeon]